MDRLKSHLLEFERDVLEKITNGEIEYGPNEFHTGRMLQLHADLWSLVNQVEFKVTPRISGNINFI